MAGSQMLPVNERELGFAETPHSNTILTSMFWELFQNLVRRLQPFLVLLCLI